MIVILTPLFSVHKSALAQTTNNNFITYDNPKFGIKIQYPADWTKEEKVDRFANSVMFLIPGSPIKYAEKLDVSILDAEPGKSLINMVNDLIDFNKHEDPTYRIVDSSQIIINGINAYKFVDTYSDPKFGNVKSMQIEMLKGDKQYDFLYTSEPGKYDKLLSTIQKMIDSFQITT